VVLAAMIGTIWVYRGVLQFVIGVDQGYIYEAFDTRADQLAMGCLLTVLLRSGHLPRLWGWLCTPGASVVALALLVASVGLSQVFGAVYRNVVGFAIDPLLVAILIAQVIALRESWLWRWLNWRWVRYLGTLSYSIYLYQQAVIHPVQQAFMSYPLPVMLGATLASVILIASVSYHLVEQPFLRVKTTIANPSVGLPRRALGQGSLDYVPS